MYKPKYYQKKLIRIKEEKRGCSFQFDNKNDSGLNSILVDENIDNILNQINEGKDIIYLSRGMRDVDLRRVSVNTWQLFDEFDIYEFEINLIF